MVNQPRKTMAAPGVTASRLSEIRPARTAFPDQSPPTSPCSTDIEALDDTKSAHESPIEVARSELQSTQTAPARSAPLPQRRVSRRQPRPHPPEARIRSLEGIRQWRPMRGACCHPENSGCERIRIHTRRQARKRSFPVHMQGGSGVWPAWIQRRCRRAALRARHVHPGAQRENAVFPAFAAKRARVNGRVRAGRFGTCAWCGRRR